MDLKALCAELPRAIKAARDVKHAHFNRRGQLTLITHLICVFKRLNQVARGQDINGNALVSFFNNYAPRCAFLELLKITRFNCFVD